jgi:hypothetical protein
MSGPPPKPTTCKEAIKRFETAKGVKAAEEEKVCRAPSSSAPPTRTAR